VYGTALLLAPQRRRQYIERNWKKSWVPTVISNARKLWQDEYKSLPGPVSVNPTSVTCEPDEYDLWEREQTVMITHGDEFERFIHGDPNPLPSGQTSLQWWLESAQRLAYPKLSRMAIDILSIPAMSAEPERVFSGARRTIDWSRMRLGVHIIEAGECLKSWMRSGIITDFGTPSRDSSEPLEEDMDFEIG
jgi:hypothetical protein